MLYKESKYNTRYSEIKEALYIFNKALKLYKNIKSFLNLFYYANLVYIKLEFTNRCLS